MLTVLDLFSGIGGFSLGLQWTGGFRTMAFCEKDTFCQKVLAKHWPTIPCYDDIHTLSATRLEEDGIEPVDLVCGGFPCQPFSVAGNQRGTTDDRYLWPEMCRVIAECRPRWVVGENVAGIVRMALDTVCTDLEAISYTVWPLTIPACAVDAPHIRERVWILACTNTSRCNRQNVFSEQQRGTEAIGTSQAVANTERCRCMGTSSHNGEHAAEGKPIRIDTSHNGIAGKGSKQSAVANSHQQRSQGRQQCRECARKQPVGESSQAQQRSWIPEPTMGRVAHGIPRRVDRLRALGNAVVPQVVEQIGRAILQVEAERQYEQS